MGVGGTMEESDYYVKTESEITIDIPGYEGVWLDQPNHYYDDIMVLADNFWDRFSLVPEIIF